MSTPVRVLQVHATGFWCAVTLDHHPNTLDEENFETLKMQLADFMLVCNMNSTGMRNYFAEALLRTLGTPLDKDREVRGIAYIGAYTRFGWPVNEIDDDSFAKLCAVAQLHQQEIAAML